MSSSKPNIPISSNGTLSGGLTKFSDEKDKQDLGDLLNFQQSSIVSTIAYMKPAESLFLPSSI